MENINQHQTIENDPDIKFLKGIEKLQNQLETLKQQIKELEDNKTDYNKDEIKILSFNITDFENQITEYFISLKKYIKEKSDNKYKDIDGINNNEIKTSNANQAMEDKLQAEISGFQAKKQNQN